MVIAVPLIRPRQAPALNLTPPASGTFNPVGDYSYLGDVHGGSPVNKTNFRFLPLNRKAWKR